MKVHTLGSVIEAGENGIKDVERLHVQNIVVKCPSLGREDIEIGQKSTPRLESFSMSKVRA